MPLKPLIVRRKANEVVEWDVINGAVVVTTRSMTKPELVEAKRQAAERLKQDKKDAEFEAQSFHSTTTIAQLVQQLLQFPQDMQVGVFAPSDPNGPCTWERPRLYKKNGQLRIDNDGPDDLAN